MRDEIKNQRRKITAMPKKQRKEIVGNNKKQYMIEGAKSVVYRDDNEYTDEDDELTTAIRGINMKNNEDEDD